jgi:hypothetical protein
MFSCTEGLRNPLRGRDPAECTWQQKCEGLGHKSLFGKVHTPLASRVNMRRIMATSMKVSLLCTFRS